MSVGITQSGENITGRVSATSDTHVEVTAQSGAACSSCSAKCGARQTPQKTLLQARSIVPMRSGQSVILEADAGALAQISLSLYLLPALGFLIGAYVGYAMSFGDLQQALFGLLGLVCGLLLARLYLRQRYSAGTPLCALQPTEN